MLIAVWVKLKLTALQVSSEALLQNESSITYRNRQTPLLFQDLLEKDSVNAVAIYIHLMLQRPSSTAKDEYTDSYRIVCSYLIKEM